VLQAIYEVDFLGFSYGFRPGRNPHLALDALFVALSTQKVSWVLDADIRGFFDSVDHEFVEHRVGDRRVLRLIHKWLKAGVLEDGRYIETSEGTPQGAVISPLLANIYLHYVLDLWAHEWRQRQARGNVNIVRYADDFVLGFQYKDDAERFLAELRERLATFRLALHPDKTRLIEFGRFANNNRKRRGEPSAEAFDFLGFTHMCGVSRKAGRYYVRRETIRRRMIAKLEDVKSKLRLRWHDKIAEQGRWLRSVVQGYFNYYGIPGNHARLETFRRECARHWLHALRRRSDKCKLSWTRFVRYLNRWLPRPTTTHPYPDVRLYAIHLR
jgi:group II intron reverse transcriptase/maturase